jgi:hypothetical protein
MTGQSMSDRELETRLRAWYRSAVNEAETAPPSLRLALVALPMTDPLPVGVGLAERLRGLRERPLLALGGTLAVVLVALAVGAGTIGRWPGVGAPTDAPSASPSLSAPAPTGERWAATGPMLEGRTSHTATTLLDGRVLISGGLGADGQSLSSAEIFDPVASTWNSAGAMRSPRAMHSATLLLDGRVLVAGGSPGGLEATYTETAEIYDPATDSWSVTGSLAVERMDHLSAALLDGRVLVIGGRGSAGYLQSAELYDSGAGSWTAAGELAVQHGLIEAVVLRDGDVLVTGGPDPVLGTPDAERYDPTTNAWARAGVLAEPRWHQTMTVMSDGRVLVVGGQGLARLPRLSSAEVFDPVSGSWTETGSVSRPFVLHSAALLPDATVVVIGSDGIERYEPATGRWTREVIGSLPMDGAVLVRLVDGRLLVTGGAPQGTTDVVRTAQIYDWRAEE